MVAEIQLDPELGRGLVRRPHHLIRKAVAVQVHKIDDAAGQAGVRPASRAEGLAWNTDAQVVRLRVGEAERFRRRHGLSRDRPDGTERGLDDGRRVARDAAGRFEGQEPGRDLVPLPRAR